VSFLQSFLQWVSLIAIPAGFVDEGYACGLLLFTLAALTCYPLDPKI
jgi:hypothetical protein